MPATPIDEARQLWRDGDADRALTKLDELIATDPERLGLWSTRGLWLDQLGRHDEALVAFRRSTAIEATYPDHYNAGNMLLTLSRLDEAIVEYDASIECKRDHPECWVNRGIALNRLGRIDEAGASFDEALGADPGFAPALRCKAILVRRLGRAADAEALFARIVELRPDDPRAALDLARALGRLPPDGHLELEPGGRDWRAIEALDHAIALRPDDPEPLGIKASLLARLMLANVSFRVWRPKEGGGLDETLVPGPLKSGRFWQDLVDLCEGAMRRFEHDDWFPSKLAAAHAFAGDAALAAKLYRRACELAPDDADHHFELAIALLDAGEEEAAALAARRAIELDPCLEAELRSELGDVLS